jgi:fructuronate reductase
MNAPTALGRLARTAYDVPPAAPVRIVHLGLGNFFRAHQAWYTGRAPDADQWGIAAFTGRSTELADALSAQDGLYTLITRAADGDTAEIIGSVTRTHPGSDIASLRGYLADPNVAIVTLTVTEAGYLRGRDGGLDLEHPDVRADVEALRAAPGVPPGTALRTMPGRLVAGLVGRRAAAAGARLAVVSCDNLPENGAVAAGVITQMANQVDPALAKWITAQVSFVTTLVDRITPASTPEDIDAAAHLTGRSDRAPVATEPYSEWVLSGDFPAGRPAWEIAGARFVSDITPFEQRKLWLLNGGHSLLAYAGSARGHQTIAEAVADPVCLDWLTQWWAEASAHLTLPPGEIADYRAALLDRFGNSRIRHLLAQVAADGSQKLPVRILPTLAAERAAGRLPTGALRVLAAWVNHLRGSGAPVRDPAAEPLAPLAALDLPSAVPALVRYLGPELGRDEAVVDRVVELCQELSAAGSGS